jgi:hypothetical protein
MKKNEFVNRIKLIYQMKNKILSMSILQICLLGLISISAKVSAQSNSDYVAVTLNNNYGKEMVIAIVQGADSIQNVTQVAWLSYNSSNGAYSWKVPDNPQSNKYLSNFIFTIQDSASLTINIPQYTNDVGFRCLVADTLYKQNALQSYTASGGNKLYMAFPDLNTAKYTFDKFEAGLTVGSPGVWNITAVDFFAIPMQLEMGATRVGFKDGVTTEGLYKLLRALPIAYNVGDTITPNTDSTTYRFFAPGKINKLATYLALDSSIADGLEALNNFKGEVTYGNYTFKDFFGGSSSGSPLIGVLSCLYTNEAIGVINPDTIKINNISSVSCFAGTISGPALSKSNRAKAEKELGALISAVTCRGVLRDPTLWGGITGSPNCAAPWNYYPKNGIYDQYAKVIHEYSIDGKNYAFPYDDYFSEEAGFVVIPGDSITVNILPSLGSLKALPEPRPAVTPGYISINIPSGTSYPTDSINSWQIGSVVVEGNVLATGNTVFCSLGSDSIIFTFPSAPEVTMTVVFGDSNIKYSGTVNGEMVTGIVGAIYDRNTSTLSFGSSSSWSLSSNANSNSQKK